MNDIAIKITNVGKMYNIAHSRGGYVTLRDTMTNVIKNPLKHAKKKVKKIIGKEGKEEFWALKDINLEIKKGEVLGIIGANGAGKSTLLKLLSRITPPTTGEIRLEGRVASLLEVGTGFHPELSGRENIFLNGAILGMTKSEIVERFDKIIDFSGIGQFIDTPVKRYSSGMFVRLAFAVAAHMDPDILIVDEVLAVGDAAFRKKSIGKLNEVSSTEGRTVLFVSHNMDAVIDLCTKTILLEHGKIVAYGETREVIGKYLTSKSKDTKSEKLPITDDEVTVKEFTITQNDIDTDNIRGELPFKIGIKFSITKPLQSFWIGIYIRNSLGSVITRSFIQNWSPELEEIASGEYSTSLSVPERLLLAGEYDIEIKAFCFRVKEYFKGKEIKRILTVYSPEDYNELKSKNTDITGFFFIPNKWSVEIEKKN